ncbi:cation diffusion facilitator family transporter [Sulfurospirillum sp. 1612]|uniref:cation diffusion facilitator family transporter n=1 Tax=Sulfurospirillum sp. 1612 TaxID=3094835 RepID=UPI002F944F43
MSLQKKATIVSSVTAIVLIVIKLTIGVISGSVAVLASAIDSMLDFIVSAFNYFAIKKSEQPADVYFNYGKGKIEALAAVIEGTIIALSGVFIFYESVKKTFEHEILTHLDSSIWVMVISLVLTIGLVIFLNYVAKKTDNMVIKADALHYKTDVYSNGVILISLVVIHFTQFYLIDAIMGIMISLYIIYSVYEIIKGGVLVLLDVALEKDLVEKIQTIIESEKEITGYHLLKTRKAGNINFVDVHLVLDPTMSLLRAHYAGDRVEDKIKEIDLKYDWVINIHLDPYDDLELNECPIPHKNVNTK